MVVDRCHRFDFARPTVEQIAIVISRVAAAESIEIAPDAVALLARHATGSFRDALGTLEQLVTYTAARIATEDVLAVLGVADADLLFEAFDAVAAGDARAAWLAAARLADTGRDIAQFLKDLEAHARDLLVVQTLGGELPPELRLTPDRDERLAEQASRVPGIEPRAPARPPGRGPAHPSRTAPTRASACVQGRVPRGRPRVARAAGARRAARGRACGRRRRRRPPAPLARPEPPRPDPTARRTDTASAGTRPSLAASHGARARAGTAAHRDRRPPTATRRRRPPPRGARPRRRPHAVARRPRRGARRQRPARRLPRGGPSRRARGREVVVAFAEHDTFNRKMADRREHRATVDDALRDLAGSALRVVFELRALEEQSAPQRPPRTSSWHASRRSSTPRNRPDHPQPDEPEGSPDAAAAEHAADAQAGPEDAAGHGGRPGGAQARGGRGLGRRRDGHGQDLRRPRDQVDRHRPGGDRSRRSRAPAGHGPGRRQRGAARRPGAAAEPGSAALAGGMDLGSLGLPGF